MTLHEIMQIVLHTDLQPLFSLIGRLLLLVVQLVAILVPLMLVWVGLVKLRDLVNKWINLWDNQ